MDFKVVVGYAGAASRSLGFLPVDEWCLQVDPADDPVTDPVPCPLRRREQVPHGLTRRGSKVGTLGKSKSTV